MQLILGKAFYFYFHFQISRAKVTLPLIGIQREFTRKHLQRALSSLGSADIVPKPASITKAQIGAFQVYSSLLFFFFKHCAHVEKQFK